MSDEQIDLRRELELRLQEVQARTLEVDHLRADLKVKDEYIQMLQADTPSTPAELIAARRYLAARSRLRAELFRHPLLWRVARRVVLQLRGWR